MTRFGPRTYPDIYSVSNCSPFSFNLVSVIDVSYHPNSGITAMPPPTELIATTTTTTVDTTISAPVSQGEASKFHFRCTYLTRVLRGS